MVLNVSNFLVFLKIILGKKHFSLRLLDIEKVRYIEVRRLTETDRFRRDAWNEDCTIIIGSISRVKILLDFKMLIGP